MTIKRGTSILEVIIATTMISMAVISALALTSKSQSQSSYARHSAQASKYASQVADWLRGERTNYGFDTISASSGTYCLSTLPDNFENLPPAGACAQNDKIDNIYYRKLTLDNSESGKVKATIDVSWNDKIERATSIELELSKW